MLHPGASRDPTAKPGHTQQSPMLPSHRSNGASGEEPATLSGYHSFSMPISCWLPVPPLGALTKTTSQGSENKGRPTNPQAPSFPSRLSPFHGGGRASTQKWIQEAELPAAPASLPHPHPTHLPPFSGPVSSGSHSVCHHLP